MQTGLKMLDNWISKHGIRTTVGEDNNQTVVTLRGGDPRAVAMKLPYCMVKLIMSLPAHRCVVLHRWYVPNSKNKLACFLFDEYGELMEQVYYQRTSRYVSACRILQDIVHQAHQQAPLAGRGAKAA